MLSLLVQVVGCGGSEDEDPRYLGDGGQALCATCVDAAPPTPLDSSHCMGLDPGVCVTDPACSAVYGLAYDRAQHCRAAGMVAVACRPFFAPCGGTYTLATDPSGGSWRLPDVCLPPGWTHPPAEPQPARWIEDYPVCPSSQIEASCAAITAQAGCDLNPACHAVTGVRVNELRRCKEGAAQFVGCTQDKGCNGLAALAKDRNGAMWELPGPCVPLNWTQLANTETNGQRHDWPACR
ncbi:MAG TPA: hypothetical protein VFZ61_00695 [Polyangiales bacterium]